MMYRSLICCLALAALASIAPTPQAAEPLRVFIRAGVKTHGPNQHDHPRLLADWTQLLRARGAQANGSMNFPTAADLDQTDVVVIYAADGMKITGEERSRFEQYLRRGGGFVVIHDGVVSGDQHEWAKKVQGGAWIWSDPKQPQKKTKWFEGEVGVYFVNTEHPITRGISNFDWKDEIYFDLDMAPDAQVLATSFHSVFVIAPQLWTYEKTWEGGTVPYRAFVSLPGHEYDVFNSPQYRAILMRGIAWAGKRSNADELCRPEELNELTYPPGGPIHPDKALQTMNVHPEFSMQLVAAEPLIEKVISLDWDPRGRLWVAETPEYPNGRTINRNDNPIYPERAQNPEAASAQKVNRPARDRISWLEDTNGDGRMDRKHVFADGLELVTSVVLHRDGVIVAQAPDILWLRDSNGDGVCDMKEGSEKVTLFTGFGTGDTHAVLSNFRWGQDGWVYSALGYSAGQPRSLDGAKSFGRVGAGIIRFKPDGSALEQYASGNCNTWGFDFGPDGEAFYTTATCGEHFLHVVLPEKILARGNVGGVRASWVVPDHQKIAPAVHHTRPAYVQIDWVGSFTATAGSCLYNGGAWPERYNGSHFCSDPTVSLVHQELLRATNTTFIASKESGREETEFLTGTDLWFRPIHTRVGPDGALFVVDFYNQAAIHNDTRGPAHGAHNAATRPDRDHHFGRVWRVQHKAPQSLPPARLDSNKPSDLAGLLRHPNGWVRDSAARLLREKGVAAVREDLARLVREAGAPTYARIAALYTLSAGAVLEDALLSAAITDPEPVVRKNALRIAYEREGASGQSVRRSVLEALRDPEPRARLNALIALGSFTPTPEIAQAVASLWPQLKDRHQQSATVGVMAGDPLLFIEAAFRAGDPAFLADYVQHAVRMLANRREPALVAGLLEGLARYPSGTDRLKQLALETLAAQLPGDVKPAWSADLEARFRALLKSQNPGLAGAVLPLVARWEEAERMKDALAPILRDLSGKLNDTAISAEERAQVAINLLGVHRLDPAIIPAVAKLIDTTGADELPKRIVAALGRVEAPAAGQELIAVYSRVPFELRDLVFEALVKRADWSMALVTALAEKKIDPMLLGASNLFRLRTHANAGVAAKANQVIDELRGPELKAKDELLTQFRAEVVKPGNVENGHKLFTENCANCHVFKNEGRNLAPSLTGMGAHGAAELLVHVIDPNRLVEPNFISTSLETKDELTYDGIIERENRAEIVLKNAAGDYTIRKDEIVSRRASGRSLMPEGFEALGAEGLRDLLAYICADENRFRIVELRDAFTANTSRGLYYTQDALDQTLRFRRFGLIKVGEVPFDIVSPAKSPTGNNVVVLKGGEGFAKTRPQRVEVKAGFPATQLHFLAAAGWGYPFGGPDMKDLPAAKVTLHLAGGGAEEILLKNGVEIADYVGSGPNYDVPGSTYVPDLVQRGQVRAFTKKVTSRKPIERIVLESFDNAVALTLVALTAELPANAAAH